MLKLAVDNPDASADRGLSRSLLAQVHIARKQLGLDEDDYRAVLVRLTGKRSAKDCSPHQLRAVIAHFEGLGFRPAHVAKRRNLGGGLVVRKAQAMWISLYQLGAIADRSDAALESFGRRQLRVDRLRWANEREGYRLIEALKAMADRYGWAQRVPGRMTARDQIRLLKDRLVSAQLARLADAGIPVSGPLAEDRSDWSEKRLESAAAELGERIRNEARLKAPAGHHAASGEETE